MTDIPVTTEELEARLGQYAHDRYNELNGHLREVFQQYGLVSPQAIPATGLIPDVVDGQLIESAWGNAIRDRTLERFDTKAALDAGWPSAANGSAAVTLDTNSRWMRAGGAWYHDRACLGFGQDANARNGIGNTAYVYPITLPVTVPAGRLLRFGLNIMLNINTGGAGYEIWLRDNAINQTKLGQHNTIGPGVIIVSAVSYLTPASGAHSYTMTVRTISGVLDVLGATSPTYLEVSDAGSATP
jgi:hypothetical protein